MTKSTILTALDIGTDSIKTLIGRSNPKKENFEILAMAQIHSAGVRKGEVIKVKKLIPAIQSSIREVQKKSGLRVKKCIFNINGNHLSTVPSQGLVSVSRADQKISEEDISRVLHQAQTLSLPSNKEILDIFPKEFIVNGEGGIKEPLGLHGLRLEVRALLIYVFSPVLENLVQALDSIGLKFDSNNIVPSPLASAKACLNFEQKELGVALVDIGAETTGLAVFEEGDLIHCHIIPLGSANITNDIAIGLRTEIETAERVKKEFGSLSFSKEKKKKQKKTKEKIEIPEKSLICSRKVLENIIESRVSEIFSQIQKELKKISKQELLPAGTVLTGGGSLLPGIEEYAKRVLKLPCRLAAPKNIPGLPGDPSFSVAVGLLLEGWDLEEEGIKAGSFSGGLGEKIRRIFKIFLP
ncbi:cell division protein FtsA [bacterium (Candidatus Gribaldobacteria) CG10_big_fil_rev_8_21_14_0_10_37_46]|uniref:Cell division protein FtsA n=1 Tax=bacterium (Candidatus Gribaldobacteria) CG10_big_fil_rev_8_21_14_0_10_37_46 TaxID=2014276 RepID=A0A2H0UWK1_9BACT|nr:MAG: cell division protein FtsA [bacterium (Candidatus Gribaldobacteria) CG10_big_fil_rev_8_21_14_0_10_37_46]